jgi:hypothetical protein
MLSRAFYKFVNSLIEEHKEIDRDGYKIDINSFPLYDKKILLSHLVGPSEYEWANQNESRINCLFQEYHDYLKEIFDTQLSTIYSQDMYEKGLICYHHKDNGEASWMKRS